MSQRDGCLVPKSGWCQQEYSAFYLNGQLGNHRVKGQDYLVLCQ